MRETSSSRIPNFLVAGGPQDLRRLMILNNSRLGAEVLYSDIQNVGGKWYAWYYEDLKDSELMAAASDKIKRVK